MWNLVSDMSVSLLLTKTMHSVNYVCNEWRNNGAECSKMGGWTFIHSEGQGSRLPAVSNDLVQSVIKNDVADGASQFQNFA
jgi:hypothetical protein